MSSSGRKKLIAIDANSLLYRAFFAMRYLSTSSGQPTNALYGLTVMILKILEESPDYIAAAFDTPEPTFRHKEYEGYKAQRKPTPEDLIAQAPLARELLRALGIPVIEAPGYEADDVIGALAARAAENGAETLIVSGDLDALQLVGDNVRVLTTVKGVSDTVVYDADAVRARFGLDPSQMADFKGLKGDPSDNIPGVPGIGDKTASELLQRYGTIENLYAHLDELPEGRVKKTLEANREAAEFSKRLATIVTDVPLEVSLEELKFRTPDYEAVRDLFTRLEFKTLLQRLPGIVHPGNAEPARRQSPDDFRFREVRPGPDLDALVRSLKNRDEIVMHCHTSGSKSVTVDLLGIAFCESPSEVAYVPADAAACEGPARNLSFDFDGTCGEGLNQLEDLLSSEKPKKAVHDAKLACSALARRGIRLEGIAFDTMLAAYLLDPSRSSYELNALAFEQLSADMPGNSNGSEQAEQPGVERVCREAQAVAGLKPGLEERLRQDGTYSLLAEVELPLAPILSEMELTGVAVDTGQLESLSRSLEADIRDTERAVYEKAGEEFNIGSPRQLQAVLFEKMGLAAARKTKTGFSTSASALDELAAEHPIVSDILRWRELTKLKSTYADALPKLINPSTGRIHTTLNQTVTATGRLSSSDPNLQNIPIKTELGRQIRRAFVAPQGSVLLSADYSQIELRILAEFTGDENLVRAFEADEDIHLATACAIFNCAPADVTPEMRRRAKTVNFAVLYGMADFTLSRNLGISVQEAREYIETYFARFPGVRQYTKDIVERARRDGYVTTLLGRRRYIPDINSSNRNIRMMAERAAINTPVQGTAADLIKLAMIKVDRRLRGSRTRMVLQVHDELLFELPENGLFEAAVAVRAEMESVYRTRVRLKVDLSSGSNWADMQPVG